MELIQLLLIVEYGFPIHKTYFDISLSAQAYSRVSCKNFSFFLSVVRCEQVSTVGVGNIIRPLCSVRRVVLDFGSLCGDCVISIVSGIFLLYIRYELGHPRLSQSSADAIANALRVLTGPS